MRLLALSLLTLAAPAFAQPAPAVDMLDLMRVPFNNDRGTFFATSHDIGALFPADGTYELIVADRGGNVLATQRYESTVFDAMPTFAELESRGGFTYSTDPAPGEYYLAVLLDDEVIGAVPFSLSVETDDDPFTPSTEWNLDGPWYTTAVLSTPSDDARARVEVYYWLHPDEAAGDHVDVREVLYRDGVEVEGAGTEGRLYASFGGPVERAPRLNVRREDLTDGAYRLDVVTEDGRTLRSWDFEVAGGEPVPHPRSALDTNRVQFLTPRAHARSDSHGGWNGAVDRVWLMME